MVSSYTRAIIRWKGSQQDLEQTYRKDFEEYDDTCTPLGDGHFLIGHEECDIHELADCFTRVRNHPACSEIFHRECYLGDY